MSVYEKENGKGAEPDWVGQSCDTDGQTEQWGSQPGQRSNSVHRESREIASKCYRLVCCASADFLQLPKALLRLLISLPFLREQPLKALTTGE